MTAITVMKAKESWFREKVNMIRPMPKTSSKTFQQKAKGNCKPRCQRIHFNILLTGMDTAPEAQAEGGCGDSEREGDVGISGAADHGNNPSGDGVDC